MSNFVPIKRNLRESLLFCFHLKKSAAESQRIGSLWWLYNIIDFNIWVLVSTLYKKSDFDTENKKHSGQSKKFENEEALLDQDPSQM